MNAGQSLAVPADKIPSSCDKTQPHSHTVLLPTGITGLAIQCELGLSLAVPADKTPSSGGVTLLEQYHALLLPGNKTPWSGDIILPYHALLLPGIKTPWSGDVILSDHDLWQHQQPGLVRHYLRDDGGMSN